MGLNPTNQARHDRFHVQIDRRRKALDHHVRHARPLLRSLRPHSHHRCEEEILSGKQRFRQHSLFRIERLFRTWWEHLLVPKVDLEKSALQKHGEAALRKKRESREKRNEKKRHRSEEARQALKELQTNKKPAKIDGIEVCVIDNTEEDQAREEDTKETKLLKKKLLNTSKRALKIYPNGHPMPIAFDIPNVSAGVFAALLDRAGDRELKTFEKKGAYIKHFDKAPSFFNSTREKLCKPYPMDSVAVTMCDGISLTYKPSTKILTFKGHGEMTHIPGDVW